ncbi:VIT family protein [Corynebacterium mendelii]|uniref:VIT1/CCC1 transporter family protein n=1 Tax=Corynebacterium mendelii TaxID=2765362 RepID=UPI00362F0CB2
MLNDTKVAAHVHEPHEQSHAAKLNWLRAGVLGANDGIVSVAALMMGVIGASQSASVIAMTGFASTVAGAVSMALGEYVSVSAQRDTEKVMIKKEKWELAELVHEEHEEMVQILVGYGISEPTARKATTEIESGDPLPAHLQLELGIAQDDLTSPWAAAGSSALAFIVGAILPMCAVLLAPPSVTALALVIVTLGTLALTGAISAKIAGTSIPLAVLRLVVGGGLGLAVTYGVGMLVGVAV